MSTDPQMLALSAFPATVARELVGVFTDIDDTLTTEGAVTPEALQALHDLKAAGLRVIAITGRPAGWSEAFALAWPLDAIVAENGAVALFRADTLSETGAEPASNGRSLLSKLYQLEAPARQANHAYLQRVLARIEQEVPGARRSTDSPGRETDIAIDHSEFTRLPAAQIAQVLQIMQSEGLQATVSSIHINGWLGTHHKLQGAYWIVRERLGRDLGQELGRWVYVGDSTNDQRMFEHFAHSVGVANVAHFADQLSHWPRYVTPSERGAGFAELVTHVLAARASAAMPHTIT